MNIFRNHYFQAGSSRTSAADFRKLALSPVVSVRRRVAENTAAPVNVLVGLLADSEAEVRQALAGNSSFPKVFLTQLALDENSDVRYALAEDASIAPDILQILTHDENPYVANRANLTLKRVSAEPFGEFLAQAG